MRMANLMIPLALTVCAYPQIVRAADADPELAFNNHCRQCHSVKQGDSRLGPSLFAVVGNKAGSDKAFPNYSPALKNSGITWTPEQLDKWIANPDAVISGHNMQPFPGVSDGKTREQIIAYLKSDTQEKPAGAK